MSSWCTPEELVSFVSETQKATRSLAKRQFTWFRGEKEGMYTWMNAGANQSRLDEAVLGLFREARGERAEAVDGGQRSGGGGGSGVSGGGGGSRGDGGSRGSGVGEDSAATGVGGGVGGTDQSAAAADQSGGVGGTEQSAAAADQSGGVLAGGTEQSAAAADQSGGVLATNRGEVDKETAYLLKRYVGKQVLIKRPEVGRCSLTLSNPS
jgi:hypothetical protein